MKYTLADLLAELSIKGNWEWVQKIVENTKKCLEDRHEKVMGYM